MKIYAMRPFWALMLPLSLMACSHTAPVEAPKPVAGADMVGVARGRVDVEGGLLAIGAGIDGVVDSVGAKEGDTVKRGDVLVELDPRSADLAVAAANAELGQSQAQAQVLAARLPPLEQQSRRMAAAARDGVATGQSADDARNAAAALKAEIAAAQADIDVARAHLAAARFARDQTVVRAPVGGRIVARNVQVGERVAAQSGKELFRLLPTRPLIVRAELGESFVDSVQPGMRAEVIADADPGHPLPAHVLRIGEVFGIAARSDDPQQSPDARVVDCVLTLDGGSLKIGQQVLVRVFRK
jgi:RND family efflux transporter MFP subunit